VQGRSTVRLGLRKNKLSGLGERRSIKDADGAGF
jgi:hypothetical protein